MRTSLPALFLLALFACSNDKDGDSTTAPTPTDPTVTTSGTGSGTGAATGSGTGAATGTGTGAATGTGTGTGSATGPVDDAATVDEGAEVLVDVLANDVVTSTTVTITANPANGSATPEVGGVRYAHDGSETLSDSFTYEVDGQTAVVTLTITPVSDPPVAVDDLAQVDAGLWVSIDLAANDTDVDDGLDLASIVLLTQPQLGTVTVQTDGTVDYQHTTDGSSPDTFTYTIADAAGNVSNAATVSVEILGTCATVDPTDPYYNRFEGIGFDNSCLTSADCVVGGCSAEVCAAEPAFTTCEGLPVLPTGSCGCVQGECIWTACP